MCEFELQHSLLTIFGFWKVDFWLHTFGHQIEIGLFCTPNIELTKK